MFFKKLSLLTLNIFIILVGILTLINEKSREILSIEVLRVFLLKIVTFVNFYLTCIDFLKKYSIFSLF